MAAAGALGGYVLTPRFIPLLPAAGLLPVAAGVAAAAAAGVALGYAARKAYDWALASFRRDLVPDPTAGQWPEGTWVPDGFNDWRVVGAGSKVEGFPPYPVYPQQETLVNWYTYGPGRVMEFTLPKTVKFAGYDVYDQVDTDVYVRSTLSGGALAKHGTFSVGRWLAPAAIQLMVRPSQGQGLGEPYPLGPMVRPVDPLFSPFDFPLPDIPETPGRSPSPLPSIPEPWILPQPFFPSPFPDVAPRAPGVEPVPQPSRRLIPPPIKPLRPPGTGRSIGVDAKPSPLPEPSVEPTPEWLEEPWPGGEPIGDPSKRPPPTLIGLATELGRQEQKLAQLGARPSPAAPDLQEIGDLLRELLGSESDNFPAGEYALRPVCERDADGNLLPARKAPWPAGSGALVEIGRKLDALAQLLQISKETLQPICRGGSSIDPAGAPVTVTFEEVQR